MGQATMNTKYAARKERCSFFQSMRLFNSRPIMANLVRVTRRHKQSHVTHTQAFKVTRVNGRLTNTINRIHRPFQVVVSGSTIINVGQAVFNGSSTVEAITYHRVKRCSLMLRVLPMVMTTIVLVHLLTARRQNYRYFREEVSPTTYRHASFSLPNMQSLRLIRRSNMVTSSNEVDCSRATPLMKEARLVPIASPIKGVPFRRVVVQHVLLISVGFIAKQGVSRLYLLISRLTSLHLFHATAIIGRRQSNIADLTYARFRSV